MPRTTWVCWRTISERRIAHGSLVVLQGRGRLADDHQASSDSLGLFTHCRHRFTTQPFGSDVSRSHDLTVRLNVPLNVEEVKAVLTTLGIIGDIEAVGDGTVITINAETLDAIRQTVDGVLVALGDL